MTGGGLRVLHVLAPAPYGGLESVVGSLARGLSDAGVDVRVAAVVEGDGDAHAFVAGLRDAGVPIDGVSVPPRAYGNERQRVGEILDRFRPHVVHTHGYRADVVDAPLARGRDLPTVSTIHGFIGGGLKNRFYEWLQTRSLRQADAVLAVARSQIDRLAASGIDRSRIRWVPNSRIPVPPMERDEARRRLGLDRDATVIGWVGRLGPEKGPDVFVRALAAMERRDAVACIVGDGPSLDETRQLARRLGVDERIRWSGRIDRAAPLMAAFDLLALSSRTEGTPMVALEAVEAGVPVVATAVGGVPDLLGEGSNVVPPESPNALAAALDRHLDDATLADEALERARVRIHERYSAEAWIEAHRSLYRELAGP